MPVKITDKLPSTTARFLTGYDFDMYNHFVTGKPMLVSGNLASMLEETRFASAFTVYGDRSVHYGAFGVAPAATKTDSDGGCC